MKRLAVLPSRKELSEYDRTRWSTMEYVANDSDYEKLRDRTPSSSFSENNDTFCSSGHVHIELAFSKRQERNGKNGDRLVARQQPPTLPFYLFHLSSTAARHSARFSIRYRDNEVLIASGNRFESQCSGIHVFRPAFFPHFSIRPFYSVSTAAFSASTANPTPLTAKRCHQQRKCYQRFFR